MNKLLGNIRFYVLLFSLVFSVIVYLWIISTIPDGILQTIRLTQIYALTAIAFLYFALLAGPLCYTFRSLPYKDKYLKARRAIGVSAFYFGSLHALLAFFGQLGGFEGLTFLSGKYLLAISLSFIAFVILGLMTATSFDVVIVKITFPKWKLLHRFVYLAGILILIHALMLGTHFQDLFGSIPQILFIALSFLFVLEARRTDAFLQKRFINMPTFGFATLVIVSLIIVGVIYYLIPTSPTGGLSFGIHAQHIKLAKEAQQNAAGSNLDNAPNIPGLQGDKTRRFTVSFNPPENIQPNVDTPLTFTVYDASSGNRVQLFQGVYEKVVHLIIVDSELIYYTHIHPQHSEKGFTITTKFPKAGAYHLYVDFQPLGAIEQQFAFTLNVGDVDRPRFSQTQPETNPTKFFGDYQVTIAYPKPLIASQMSVGQQLIAFTIKDKNRQQVTNLKPYLAAFGHLVMINEQTFDYLHIHPTNLIVPKPDENGGPKVEFMPLGLYGPIKPGTYRVFAQFNPDNKLFTADFTVKIE